MSRRRRSRSLDPERPYPFVPYKLPNGTRVLLTPRPDVHLPKDVAQFIDDHEPKVRFQLTDDQMRRPILRPSRVHWYPWRPGRRLPVELVYPALVLLDGYVKKRQTIWMHCDSSSMRAPTFFGLYLRAYWPEQIESICNTEWHLRARYHSSPVEYSSVSLRLDPEMAQMIRAWQLGGEVGAYSFCHRRKVDPGEWHHAWLNNKEKWSMDFEGFYEHIVATMPKDFRQHAHVLNFLEQVEYNSGHFPIEIYKPKDEIELYLKEISRADQHQAEWITSALSRLAEA